jgi:pyrimidine operon attenuation protein/uracil phosphoribosyltransferase
MRKRILDSQLLDITINRLCHQLIENHGNFDDSVIIGLQPRGIYPANRIHTRLQEIINKKIPIGYLDSTFYRDDFRRRESPKKANATNIAFIIENKKVILIDDVLFTGRSIRASLDAMIAFGRPQNVELLVLINRRYSRQLPIEPMYVGRHVNTIESQIVLVEWKEQGKKTDNIWLLNKEE